MIFVHNNFISEPMFKLFVALFRTHELQKDGMVTFFLWFSRKVRFQKMQFLKDGVQTVASQAVCAYAGNNQGVCLLDHVRLLERIR